MISLTGDLDTKNAWESSLVTQLNNVPFVILRKCKENASATDKKCYYKIEVTISNARNEIIDNYYNEHPEIPVNEQDYIMPQR